MANKVAWWGRLAEMPSTLFSCGQLQVSSIFAVEEIKREICEVGLRLLLNLWLLCTELEGEVRRGKLDRWEENYRRLCSSCLNSAAFLHATNTIALAKHATEMYEGVVSYKPLKRLNFAEESCGKVDDTLYSPFCLSAASFLLHKYNSQKVTCLQLFFIIFLKR